MTVAIGPGRGSVRGSARMRAASPGLFTRMLVKRPISWKRATATAASAVALLGASGCYYSKADGEKLRDEVFALQTQVTALQRELAAFEKANARNGEQLARVANDVSELNSAARRNDADIGVVLDVVRQDVARMKGQVDSLNERLSEVEGSTAKTREELDLRFQSLAEADRIREAESAKAKQAAIEAAEKRAALLSKPKIALERAEALLEEGKPAEARALVRALEIEQKKSKSWGAYAPKAQYLIAESYFAEEDFRQAAAAYNAVRKRFPKSSTWLPGSILKMGMCFERLGLREDARLFYETVSKKYPKHPAGREGKRLLSQL